MGDTYICDSCDERITSGYTVCWARKLTDSPAGIHWSDSKDTVNLCGGCFPDEHKPLVDRVVGMLSAYL